MSRRLLSSSLLAAGLLALSSAVWAQSTAAPAEAPTDQSAAKPRPPVIELFQSSHRLLVMMKIGDSPPMPFVFDTGTNGNLVDLKIAERLGLPHVGPSKSIDGSTGLPVPGFETFIRGASLGGVPIDDARATAFAWDDANEVGIVGPNSFPGKFVQMDLTRSALRILTERPGDPADPGFAYLGEKGDALPSLTLVIGGQSVPAILDTGNNSDFLLPLSMAAGLTLESAPVVIGQAVSAAGSQPVYEARLAGDVTIAGVVFSHPRLRFMEGGRPNIGLPALRRLSLVFDPVAERTWVVAPS